MDRLHKGRYKILNPNGHLSPRHNAVSAIALTMFSDFVLEGVWTRETPTSPGFYVSRSHDASTIIIRMIRTQSGYLHCLDPIALLQSAAIWSRPLPVDVLPSVPETFMRRVQFDEDDGA